MYPILAFIHFSLPFLLPRLLALLPSPHPPLFQYNTSIQLGPQTPHLPPSATAHTCTVLVTATSFEYTTDKYRQLQWFNQCIRAADVLTIHRCTVRPRNLVKNHDQNQQVKQSTTYSPAPNDQGKKEKEIIRR